MATSGAAGLAVSEGGGGAAGSATTGGGGVGTGGVGGSAPAVQKPVLLYYFSTLTIATVAEQLSVLTTQLEKWGYDVEQSADPAVINPAKLATLSAVGMINTCFEPFGKGSDGATQSAALAAFVEAGGGLFGTHCASVTFQSANPPSPYNQLLGGRGGDGYFNGKSSCTTVEPHPTTSRLAPTFEYEGDLDNADFVGPDTKVLVKCQWLDGAKKEVPVSWYRTPGKGRVFYTNFAKEVVDLKDPTLGEQHVLPGLGWVLGR